MKKLILALSILMLSLNYCQAQPIFPGGKPKVRSAKVSYAANSGLWIQDGTSYTLWYKLNPVNLQKAVKEFKRLLELNGGSGEYTDQSIWPTDMEKDNYESMELHILTGRGELLMLQNIGTYIYGVRCSQETGEIFIMVVKATTK